MEIYCDHETQRQAIVNVMKQGQYYQRIMDSGPELNRVKQFLNIMEGIQAPCPSQPYQEPTILPVFPGLKASAFHSRKNDPIAQYLESHYDEIAQDILNVKQYCLDNRKQKVGLLWRVFPIWYLGVDLKLMSSRVPNLKRIVDQIPRSGQPFPLSESIVSWLEPHAHLPAHSSTDCLRLRYSLGIVIEDFCEIRVGATKEQWTKGECIIFEDCFEHEAWNGGKERAVYIIDTWHPDLTDIEIEALSAGFRKLEVRTILYHYRSIHEAKNFLFSEFKRQDNEPMIAKYWSKDTQFVIPNLESSDNWASTPRFSAQEAD